jgi:hypothetical protein
MFKSLREGKLLRYLNTYHCKINDKWYGNESMTEVLTDVCEKANMQIRNLSLDEILAYTNLYLNKNKNFCIDHIYTTIIKPFIDRAKYDEYRTMELGLFGTKLLNEPIAYRDFKPHGYCCSDCDGDYSDYKSSQYRQEVGITVSKAYEMHFKELLRNQRKTDKYTPASEILK